MRRSGERARRRNADGPGLAVLAAMVMVCSLGALGSASRVPAARVAIGCVKNGGAYALKVNSPVDRDCPERLKHLAGARMDLNRMSGTDFDLLPGIGPEKSGRLVEQRQKSGGFATVEQAAATAGGRAGQSLLTFAEVER